MELINLSPDETVTNSQNNLLFVGVMTAKDFLNDRAKAVYDTWGKDVVGRLAFFSSEGSVSDKLPVVGLKGVDDRYPPQKKSFRMLYYMYEHYIDRFEWFARADDDVYINTRKLEKFLRSIDSTKPQFIGRNWLLGFFMVSRIMEVRFFPQVKREGVIQKNLDCCRWNLTKTFACNLFRKIRTTGRRD